MRWRTGAIAAVRALNAGFFLSVSAFCFLCSAPFAYVQFIKPSVLPELTDFILLSPWLFWLGLLSTTLTLMPQLRGGRGQTLARAYVGASVAVGVWALVRSPLKEIGNTGWAFELGVAALLPPLWLGLIDHVVHDQPTIEPGDPYRALSACASAAGAGWAVYALFAPLRLHQAIGINLSATELAMGLAASLVVDLFVFMALFLALMAIAGLADLTRWPGPAMYWSSLGLLAAATTLVVARLVCASIAFTGWPAWTASALLSITIGVVWADLAWLRARAPGGLPQPLDPLTLFSAPIAGIGRRVGPAGVLVVLPLAAYGVTGAISHLDWNFLLQKLTVLAVWLTAFASVCALVRASRPARRRAAPLVIAPLMLGPAVSLGLFGAADSRPGARRSVLERYAAIDPSFRLIRDARTLRSAETAEYYERLRAHTLLSPRRVHPPQTAFVGRRTASRDRDPDIFLIVIDSLRQDYVSTFNPRVTFTPEMAKLAADSFAFERAFTRYAGTGLSVPSIWAGGMVVHMVEQPSFEGRNALLRMLEASHYLRFMDMDNIVSELMPVTDRAGEEPQMIPLDRGRTSMDFDLCRTFGELEEKLAAAGSARPVFFYALPQNVHIAVAARRPVPEGEAYPGFFAPVASSVRRVDGCIGGFVEYLKRAGRYDNSIIILTSDHGDALGEEGRWGHADFLFPEVMRVPLIVHLPPRLKARFAADLSAVSFTIDITPTLYALLGYPPVDCGGLCGGSLFVRPDEDPSWRKRESFLTASSYGAVYGMLRRNGRRLYAVDAVDGGDYAFDLGTRTMGERLEITRSMTTANRALILDRLAQLAALYGYQGGP